MVEFTPMHTRPKTAFAATVAAPSSHSGPPFQPGSLVLGKYRIEKQLGEGTFGWVFAASQGTSRVALKVIKPQHADDASIITRLQRRELASLLRIHKLTPTPHVITPTEPEVLTENGYLMLVLSFVAGPSLSDVLSKQRQLGIDEARGIALGLARGLAAIHAADVVHRDLKPDNIRLDDQDRPVILDLGIAKALWETGKLTGTGQAMMTPYYASPEQLISPQDVGAKSDVYAFGLIVFEMLTGFLPLSGDSMVELIQSRTARSAPDPRVVRDAIPVWFSALILRCLERVPAQRPSSNELVGLLLSSTVPGSPSISPLAQSLASESTASPSVPAPTPSNSAPAPPPDPSSTVSSPPGQPRRWMLLFALVVIPLGAGVFHLVSASHLPIHTPPSASTSAAPPPSVPAPPPPAITLSVPSKLFHKKPLTARVQANQKLFLAMLIVDASGAGTLLIPGRDAMEATLLPGVERRFPEDLVRSPDNPPLVEVQVGRKSTKESLWVIGASDRDELYTRLPPGAAQSDLLALKASEVKRLKEWAQSEPSATFTAADYEVTR